MCAMAAFSGKRLGDCWSIIEERDPSMRTKKRNPYAIIADQTLGRTWSVVVSMAIVVTLFGASVVYLLLASQIIGLLLLTLLPTVTICMAPNVAASLAATPLTLVGNVLMVIHLVFAFIILINPVCQEMEELYNVPHVLFIGESIPRFYTILSLVGGTSVALLTFVLPPLCYLTLVNQTPREGQTPV
ncbi:hypothetical protein OBRU01_00873 [Operophtera brumata]|uniref:Amino acid transporter transmembrane domain-containing protein n=1 Tax=Operophtera brumata TaxID=104452 RepID=A0A0L7LVK1_OPEBR|nr:hypothetical protein OBRU01_00873 [Operophtera brumata]